METTSKKGKSTISNEGNHLLHGDWLIVSRRKKFHNNSTLNAPKTVTKKNNMFNALSSLTNQNLTDPTNHKILQWSKTNETSRGSTNFVPKRRIHEDPYVPITKILQRQFPSNLKTIIVPEPGPTLKIKDMFVSKIPPTEPQMSDQMFQPEQKNPDKITPNTQIIPITDLTSFSPLPSTILIKDHTAMDTISPSEMLDDTDVSLANSDDTLENSNSKGEDMVT